MVDAVVQNRSLERNRRALPRVRGRFGCSAHERRVTVIALRLFDLLAPLHGLGKSYRKVLRAAALLHDAARPLGADNHHIAGARMIFHDEALNICSSQRRRIAYLVRYHCGPVPPSSRSEFLRPDDRRRKMRRLLAFLRAADGLDSRRISASAIIIKRKGRRVRIHCWVDDSLARAQDAFQRRRKFKLLEKSLDLQLSVRVDRLLNDI